MLFKLLKMFLLLSVSSTLLAQPYGVEWEILSSPTENTLRRLHFIDSKTGWAVGAAGTIIHTTDGGENWVVQNSNVTTFVTEVFFLNSNLGWALTLKDAPPFGTQILKTTDGGNNWVVEDFMGGNEIMYTIFFFDSLNGFIGGRSVSGTSGNIAYTTDGGTTWTDAIIDSSLVYNFPVYKFKFFSREFGYACGGRIDLAGVIWRTTNYGMNWSAIGISPDEIFDLYIIDSLNAIALSGDPEGFFAIANIKTTDAGITWISDSLSMTGLSFAIDFRTSNEGWSAAGYKFLFTSDRGETWIEKSTPANSTLYDVQFTDTKTGYAVGDSGVVLKLNPAAVNVENNMLPPDKFILHQNYPNPFNPNTSIRYTTGSKEFVSLKIYNLLGKEIATLVNEEKPAGNYDVNFDASGLTSGIYLYRLRAGSYTQSKKMVYIK
jgi:photosystem II stability/assembly factor-like uncharacterized protein